MEPESGQPVTILNKTVEVLDNVSYMTHGHMMKFGGEFRSATATATRRILPILIHLQWPVFHECLADLFWSAQRDEPGLAARQCSSPPEVAFFFQDDWKLRPNLALSIGVRWEPIFRL